MSKMKKTEWPLAPAPESKDPVRINEQYELFIGGKWVKPKGGKYFDITSRACCRRRPANSP